MPWGQDTSELCDPEAGSPSAAAAEMFLAARNIESLIDSYLLDNGTIIDTRTRVFLANIRDVMGAVSRHARRVATAQSRSWPT